jgi:cyclic pyranopterin phosphate synthase
MAKLTHIDAEGKARMVDVSAKDVTERVAIATGSVVMAPATLKMIVAGAAKKGDVLSVARLAGIMGAKRTAELIPLCHPIALDSIQVDLECDTKRSAVDITATCKIASRTGVEMEALTAVAVAALTVYDMCKAVDRSMRIGDIALQYKSGGKSGTFRAKAKKG